MEELLRESQVSERLENAGCSNEFKKSIDETDFIADCASQTVREIAEHSTQAVAKTADSSMNTESLYSKKVDKYADMANL